LAPMLTEQAADTTKGQEPLSRVQGLPRSGDSRL